MPSKQLVDKVLAGDFNFEGRYLVAISKSKLKNVAGIAEIRDDFNNNLIIKLNPTDKYPNEYVLKADDWYEKF